MLTDASTIPPGPLVTPRSFIDSAKIHRQKDRVFVAMPFGAPHSEELWKVLLAIGTLHQLNLRRADSPEPGAIVAKILEELESAEIVIADLTGLNSNVIYEVGFAHARLESVILLAQRGESLPFDLAAIRCLFFDLRSSSGRRELSDNLGHMLESIRAPQTPTVLDDKLARTKSVISDLKMLSDLPDSQLQRETIWFSGYLSSFAISEEETFAAEDEDYRRALFEEKNLLLHLAQRGCTVHCIISPPDNAYRTISPGGTSKQRLKALIAFVESGHPALANIDWVVSPFRQKNFYIIGGISFSEGFKSGIERGYALTLRLTDPHAISSTTAVHKMLFERLRRYTLDTYPVADCHGSQRELLRRATLVCLKKSLQSFAADADRV